MKYAVVQSGGKQFRCEEGGVMEIDRLQVEAGSTHTFTEVLLLADEGAVKVGTPTVSGAKVTATVVAQVKGPKLTVFHYKAKERQRRKTGHRQKYTQVKIESIEG
jgi:large subunit ribosomal protein L21